MANLDFIDDFHPELHPKNNRISVIVIALVSCFGLIGLVIYSLIINQPGHSSEASQQTPVTTIPSPITNEYVPPPGPPSP